MANVKTNAMRILEKAGIPYKTYNYDCSNGLIDGISVATKLGQPIEKVYKTLVTRGTSREYYVFVIPVAKELDLKAAAKAVGEKAVEMIKVTDMNKVTGYIRGGCSPIGMKKEYKTVLDSSCKVLDTFIVSAGKLGHQIEIDPKDLSNLLHCSIESITMQQ
ncbi:Cys-tRNA(Pro) deacylase [Clostridium formicaceticum]|uniref:Cys-tRNA(Pro)/Cys-tRNA(Cys) deacylase n=1 Tax=Clostridium formicaceticum TaxID=1497 RepID=A0AAC9RJR2_9CLOT|nr:Cys-tRNA(Pro) deacylase [Clostridium formicaceticum]AOY77778.1 aminoacyl-tRNA deacylase [Clostridium formicaceticum]ARE88384.1 Cys-tRNA(Pro)/Cys-tRNA(Cys) deacylase YbaK [Clostridium formicaceticum]